MKMRFVENQYLISWINREAAVLAFVCAIPYAITSWVLSIDNFLEF